MNKTKLENSKQIVRLAMYDVMGFEKEEFNNESEFISDLKMSLEDTVNVVNYIEEMCNIEITNEVLSSLVKVQDLIDWLDIII